MNAETIHPLDGRLRLSRIPADQPVEPDVPGAPPEPADQPPY